MQPLYVIRNGRWNGQAVVLLDSGVLLHLIKIIHNVCTAMALPIPPLGQCFLLHPLKPLSCTSKRCIGLQPDLFFQQIHSSGHTGRILIRLLSSPWVSFDLNYNLPKKRLHVQPWVSEQTLTPLAPQPPAMVPAHHRHHALDPTPSHTHGAGLQPSWQSKWCEGGQPQRFCWSPPLFMQI